MYWCCGWWRCSDHPFRAAHAKWAGVTPVRGRATKQRSAVATAPGSFRLAMFGHTGAIGIELLIAPEVLRITRRPNAALVQSLRPLHADSNATALRIARRCGRADGNNDGERGQTFLKVNHDESPSSCRPVSRKDLGAAGGLVCSGLPWSAGSC